MNGFKYNALQTRVSGLGREGGNGFVISNTVVFS